MKNKMTNKSVAVRICHYLQRLKLGPVLTRVSGFFFFTILEPSSDVMLKFDRIELITFAAFENKQLDDVLKHAKDF